MSFLLVCLLLCPACGRKTAVFSAAGGEELAVRERTFTESPAEEESKEEQPSAVNINTADAAELMTLPGIGQVRADAIIEERSSGGRFEKIEDIMRVKGIKEGIFNKISSCICVE